MARLSAKKCKNGSSLIKVCLPEHVFIWFRITFYMIKLLKTLRSYCCFLLRFSPSKYKSLSDYLKWNNKCTGNRLGAFITKSICIYCFLNGESNNNMSILTLEILWAMLIKWYPPASPCFVWQSPCFALGNPKIIRIKT